MTCLIIILSVVGLEVVVARRQWSGRGDRCDSRGRRYSLRCDRLLPVEGVRLTHSSPLHAPFQQ